MVSRLDRQRSPDCRRGRVYAQVTAPTSQRSRPSAAAWNPGGRITDEALGLALRAIVALAATACGGGGGHSDGDSVRVDGSELSGLHFVVHQQPG